MTASSSSAAPSASRRMRSAGGSALAESGDDTIAQPLRREPALAAGAAHALRVGPAVQSGGRSEIAGHHRHAGQRVGKPPERGVHEQQRQRLAHHRRGAPKVAGIDEHVGQHAHLHRELAFEAARADLLHRLLHHGHRALGVAKRHLGHGHVVRGKPRGTLVALVPCPLHVGEVGVAAAFHVAGQLAVVRLGPAAVAQHQGRPARLLERAHLVDERLRRLDPAVAFQQRDEVAQREVQARRVVQRAVQRHGVLRRIERRLQRQHPGHAEVRDREPVARAQLGRHGVAVDGGAHGAAGPLGFGAEPGQHEEAAAARGHLRGGQGLVVMRRLDRGAQVVEVGQQAVEPRQRGAEEVGVIGLAQAVEHGVQQRAVDGLALAGGRELLGGEGARRLEQAQARRLAGLHDDERLVDQRAEVVEQLPVVGGRAARHALRGLQREAAGENAEAAEHGLLGRRRAGHGSIEAPRAASAGAPARCARRAVSSCSRASSRACTPAMPSIGTRAAASSMASALPSSARHSCDRDVQAGRVEPQARVRRARARREQRHGAVLQRLRRRSAGGGHVQATQAVDVLVGVLQRLLRRDEQRRVRRRAQQRVGEPAGRFEQVLAVVEHDEQRLRAQRVGHVVVARGARQRRRAERAADRGRHFVRRRERRQLDDPHAVGEARAQLVRHGLRDARLADAAGPDDAHEPVLLHVTAQRRDVDHAAEERGRRGGHVRLRRARPPRRGAAARGARRGRRRSAARSGSRAPARSRWPAGPAPCAARAPAPSGSGLRPRGRATRARTAPRAPPCARAPPRARAAGRTRARRCAPASPATSRRRSAGSSRKRPNRYASASMDNPASKF